MSTFSTFDITKKKPEKVYHAFVLGLLVGLQGRYEIKSNRESGLGRYDVMLIPKNPKDLGIVMEFKKIGDFETTDIETAFASVWKQIDNKRYAQELIDRGICRILYLAFVFKGKQVEIRHKES